MLVLYLAVDDKRLVQSYQPFKAAVPAIVGTGTEENPQFPEVPEVPEQADRGDFALPSFHYGDRQPLKVFLLKRNPAGGDIAPYTLITEERTVKIAVGTPDVTTTTQYANATLLFDASDRSYNGELNLFTSEVQTYLTGVLSRAATFELEVKSASTTTTAQFPVTLFADTIKEGVPPGMTQGTVFATGSYVEAFTLGKNRYDEVTSLTTWDLIWPDTNANGVVVITSSGSNWNFGNNAETIARRKDVATLTGGGTYQQPVYQNFPSGTISPYATRKDVVDGGTFKGRVFALNQPVSNNELATRAFVLANSGTTPVGEGLERVGNVVQVAWGTNYGTQVPRGNHFHLSSTVIEDTNQFHTVARVRATTLPGLDALTQGAVTPSDTILSSIGKLEATKLSQVSGTISPGPLWVAPRNAASPAIAATTDNDTGVFWPAENQMAFSQGGVEVMRVRDSSLSIGTTDWLAKLGVKATQDQVIVVLSAHAQQTADILEVLNAAGLICRVTRYGGIEITNDGIPAADPKGLKIISNTPGGNAGMNLVNNTLGTGSRIELLGSGDVDAHALRLINTLPTGDIIFATNNVERARFIETGLLGLNTNNPQAFLHLLLSGATKGVLISQGAASTGDLLLCQVGSGTNTLRVDGTGNTTIRQPIVIGAVNPALKITTEWASANHHEALVVDVTDTISHTLAQLLNLRVGGVNKLRVYKSGYVNTAQTTIIASPEAGDIWSDSTSKARKVYEAGMAQALEGVLFTSTADANVASTGSETTIAPAGTGTKTLPANFFVGGKTLKVKVLGTLRTKASAVGTLTIRLKFGSTTIAATEAFTPTASLSDTLFELEGMLTCRTTGATGTVVGVFAFSWNDTTVPAMKAQRMYTTFPLTLDTTASHAVDITAQWQTADASNSITTRLMSLEVLN